MTFETFKKILDLQQSYSIKNRKLYKLGVDLIEISEDLEKAIDLLWNEVLTKEGEENLSWFMFEKDYVSGELREDIKAFDGEEEILKDVQGLYDYLIK